MFHDKMFKLFDRPIHAN